jgi:hypothetical protein
LPESDFPNEYFSSRICVPSERRGGEVFFGFTRLKYLSVAFHHVATEGCAVVSFLEDRVNKIRDNGTLRWPELAIPDQVDGNLTCKERAIVVLKQKRFLGLI